MAEKMRFGIFIPQILPILQVIEQCKFVEALGYESLWIGDQFYNPLRLNEPMWEAWKLLSAIAVQTTRIRLGTLAEVKSQLIRTTRLLYAGEALRKITGQTIDPGDRPDYERTMLSFRARLGGATFAMTWAEDQARTEEQVIALAMGDEV